MSHRPLFPDTTVSLWDYLNAAYISASVDVEGKKKKKKASGPPVRLDQPRRHLGNEDGASAVLS